MKMKKYYNFLSKRLMSIYIIYITVFTLVAYTMCLWYVRNDLKNTEKQYLESLSESLENHLAFVADITATLNNNPNVVNFSTSEEELDYAEVTQVMNVMRQTNTANTFGSEFAVINVESEKVVSAEGSMDTAYFEKKLGIENNKLQILLKKISDSPRNSIEIITSDESCAKKYLVTVFATSSGKSKPVTFVSMYSLDALFKNIPNDHLPQIISIDLSNKTTISYNSESNPKINFKVPKEDVGIKEVASYSRPTNFWGKINTTVYVSTLSYYLYINNFFIFLLLFIVVMGVIGHLYTKSKANQMYTPVQKIMHSLPKDATQSDDEFETMGKYFSSLETQKNAMSDIISENKIQLRDRFITQLFTATLTKEQIKSELVTYSLEEIAYPGVSCIIGFKNFDELKTILTTDGISEVRAAVKDCFYKHFSNAKYIKMIELDQQTFGAIICSKDIDALENMLKKCVLNIEMMLDINMIVYMGSVADSWYEVPASYADAVTLKNKSRIITDQSIVISHKSNMEDNTIVYATEHETELINYVLSENTNMVSACLEKIIDANLANNFLSHEYFSHFVTMLYSTIIKILTSINKTEKEVFAPMSVYLELMNCDNAAALKSTAMNLFGIIISDISSVRETTTIDSTQYIVNYVNNHYAEDISLFTLAEYLNMSQSHASKTFKQAIGENFKDYVTNIRLSKATEIMDANPYIKILDVAKAVGYTSETFTKAFTKKYNMTPSAYLQKK